MSITKNVLLNWYSSSKRNQKDLDDFWLWKLSLKIRFWHFLTAIFGHLTSLMKKSNAFLWSAQSYLQSEMFLSNSVDVMKYLPLDVWLLAGKIRCLATHSTLNQNLIFCFILNLRTLLIGLCTKTKAKTFCFYWPSLSVSRSVWW